jgi:peroxiredoxin
VDGNAPVDDGGARHLVPGVPFKILSDVDGAFQRALHLPTFAAGPETYLNRLTLIVADGAVRHAFYPVHSPETHAEEILVWLRTATPA